MHCLPIYRSILGAAATAGLVLVLAGPAAAQDPSAQVDAAPGVVVEGSATVRAGALPAARQHDATSSGSTAVEGSSNVFINGRPAARLGDRTGCGGVIVSGSSNVLVNGRPLARAGDPTSGCAGN